MLCSQQFTNTTSQLIIIIYKHNIDNTELLLLVMLIILKQLTIQCENTLAHNIRLKVILFSGDEAILIAYYFQEITMKSEKYYSNHKFQDNAGSFSNDFVNHLLKILIIYIFVLIKISEQ